jgi:hypothetical protein
MVAATESHAARDMRILDLPADVRIALGAWLDVDGLDADVFWVWFRTVLPLLPRPGGEGAGPRSAGRPAPERLRELAEDLVTCAQDRARLTVMSERYYRDNQSLARRVKALEAALQSSQSRGSVADLPDDEAVDASERYLPQR